MADAAHRENSESAATCSVGRVVKLDRGFPLVQLGDRLVRCEHAIDLVKKGDERAVVGDEVEITWPEGHDKAIIARILPRKTQLVRKDPAERAQAQVLAANFDLVIIAQPVTETNIKRLERELVLAFETGAEVAVVLTKADLADDETVARVASEVKARAGSSVQVLSASEFDEESIAAVRALVSPATTAVLVGKSGVGKSSLINLLVGREVQQTGAVREADGRGRHTTVSREIVELPGGGFVVDMPGVRGLGMWESDEGIGTAFSDIEELAQSCRFRDCRHGDEPGCAVSAAIEAGELAPERLASYRSLKQETDDMRQRRIETERKAQRGRPRPGKRTAGRKNASAFSRPEKGRGKGGR